MAKYLIFTAGKIYYEEGSSYFDAYQKASSKWQTDTAFDLATNTSSTGLGMAAANIAVDLVGKSVNKKIDKAVDLTLQGNAMFFSGDMDSALKLYEKVFSISKMTAGPALAKIGYIYFKQGNNEKAFEYYKKAINSSAVVKHYAYIYRSELYEKLGDKEKALMDCCAAVNGDYSGTYARYVVKDNKSVEVFLKDYIEEYGMDVSGFEKRCFPLFKTAAESGNKRAYAALAECYDQGYGTAKNEQEAMKWFEKAEKAGYINGMHKMKKSFLKIVLFSKLYQKTNIIFAILLAILIGIPTVFVGVIPGFIIGWKFGGKIRQKILPCSSI